MKNIDRKTVDGFGYEWKKFDQRSLSEDELRRYYSEYFKLFPWERLPENAEGFDLGCGSGRWARFTAERAGTLHCIDPSKDALEVARENLADKPNCRLHLAGVDEIPLADNSMDFGYSLGVLHHVPDTRAGIAACAAKLKPGAPFLIYLYYAFDNRPGWFRALWKASDVFRRGISAMPPGMRYVCSQIIAAAVYFPAARLALLLEKAGLNVDSFPLSTYRRSSFYTMRTDALDRFGTRLEQRFTADQIEDMMKSAGLEEIQFNREAGPYWCAVGFKRRI